METKIGKKSDRPLFQQILDLITHSLFRKSRLIYRSDKHCSKYFTRDQLVCMLFGQLNRCLSLREIAIGIDQSPEFMADIGLDQSPAKSSMSDGNAKRDYRVFEDVHKRLCRHYKE